MNILLIDDEAENGWKQIVEKVLFNGELIHIAIDNYSAKVKLEQTVYDLIFLDLRFGEEDHLESDIKKFGGYKILKEQIRNSLYSVNYSTPVLIFTASNKIWNITEMLEAGADDYYIKEHPDNAYDLDFSRENYFRLKGDNKVRKGIVHNLIELGFKRKEILDKVKLIIKKTNTKIEHPNIKNRIQEKLKIGYGILFRKTTQFENENLLFNNEHLAFVVFWSILEEISKDYFKDNWIKGGNDDGGMVGNNWVLKNGVTFIEDNIIKNFGKIEGNINVRLFWENGLYMPQNKTINHDNKEIRYYTGKINLSLQLYAIIILGKNFSPQEAKNCFEPLNDFRNKIDFIHSSVETIFNETLSNDINKEKAYAKCNEMLDFISKLLQ